MFCLKKYFYLIFPNCDNYFAPHPSNIFTLPALFKSISNITFSTNDGKHIIHTFDFAIRKRPLQIYFNCQHKLYYRLKIDKNKNKKNKYLFSKCGTLM